MPRRKISNLPAELAPRRADLLLPASAKPQPEDMIFCAPTPEDLELPTPTLEDVVSLISEIPFAAGMSLLSVLAAELHHHPRDRGRHLRLAGDIYRGDVWRRFQAFVEESPSHLGFDARHVAAVQRLMVTHAAPDPAIAADLDRGQVGRIAAAVLGVGSALPQGTPPAHDPASPEDWAAWVRYTALVGAWHDDPEVAEAMARAHAMWVDVHADPALSDHPARCDVDSWVTEEYGLTLGEQLAGGMACAAVTTAFDAGADPRERMLHIEPGFMRTGGLADKEPALLKLISATREELQALVGAAADDPARMAWDHTLFEQRPYLRAPDGTLRLISPRGLLSWMTRGMHHRVLQVAERRPHPRRAGKSMSLILLGYVGALGEEAARRLVKTSHAEQERQGVVRIHGEHEYRIGKRRQDSPDQMLDYGEDLVVVEVYSGRISRDARTSLDQELLRKAIDKATTVKLVELAARTRELLDGELTYEGLDLGRVRRIWPMLLLAGDPILQTPALWHYLREVAPEAFLDDARVRRPMIMGLDDIEPLLAVVQEEGRVLPSMLNEISTSPYAELPPRNWVHATVGGILRRPRYVEDQGNAAMRLVGTTLFPGSERMAKLRLDADAGA